MIKAHLRSYGLHRPFLKLKFRCRPMIRASDDSVSQTYSTVCLVIIVPCAPKGFCEPTMPSCSQFHFHPQTMTDSCKIDNLLRLWRLGLFLSVPWLPRFFDHGPTLSVGGTLPLALLSSKVVLCQPDSSSPSTSASKRLLPTSILSTPYHNLLYT